MLNEFQSAEVWYLLAGQQIGSGAYRRVYECRLNPDWVVKLEEADGRFANVAEWNAWLEIQHLAALRKFVAPCVRISPCGLVLIQMKTSPVTREELPTRIPSCFTDLKIQNWGKLKGRPVCHDYGFMINNYASRLRKAEWWSETDY